MILEVFSNLNDSMILYDPSARSVRTGEEELARVVPQWVCRRELWWRGRQHFHEAGCKCRKADGAKLAREVQPHAFLLGVLKGRRWGFVGALVKQLFPKLAALFQSEFYSKQSCYCKGER